MTAQVNSLVNVEVNIGEVARPTSPWKLSCTELFEYAIVVSGCDLIPSDIISGYMREYVSNHVGGLCMNESMHSE